MYQKVLDTIEAYNMIQKNDTIVIGFSGGADSASLLWILNHIKSELNFNLIAIHVHHGLRGTEADRDASFAKKMCNKLNVPIEIEYRDIKGEAILLKISEEEAGRKARYEIFNKKTRELNSGKIATAHHMNDQAETILFNLMRGSGMKGLKGISPKRDNIIRPLINCSRDEIVSFCKENDIKYIDDYTNGLDLYTRNHIRLNLIPFIEKNYNPSFVKQMNSMASIISDENDFLELETEKTFRAISEFKKGEILISVDALNSIHAAIRKRIYRNAIQAIGARLKDVENKHILLIDQLRNKQTGKYIYLPNNIIVKTVYNNISFKKGIEYIEPWEYEIEGNSGTIDLCLLDYRMNWTLKECQKPEDFPEKMYTKWFDYDKIRNNLSVRNRRLGDYIYLNGVLGKKKLKDFFIDNKVPKDMRDKIPIIADGSNVIWIVGYRISEYYKITKETKRILEVVFTKED